MFGKKIEKDYLKLAQVIYGGEFYLKLKNYKIKEVNISNPKIKQCTDSLLSKKGIGEYFCYKNPDSGFAAGLFENKKTNDLVIAYRGTERLGLGENESDIISFMKDVSTDSNLFVGIYDEQFRDGWNFYKSVKNNFPKSKITITGHSLGGAIAQIVVAKEYTINRKKIKAYTFNAPGCSDLLDTYDCNTSFDYSFVLNYSVMNDWCGMYGKHIGKRYLIPPIALNNVSGDNTTEILNNILLTSHEGIFDILDNSIPKIIKKPKDFNQKEGLSLWYFDKNNPVNNYKSISDFIGFNIPQAGVTEELKNNPLLQKTEKFIKENMPENMQNSNIATAIKNVTDNIVQIQNDGINNWLNNSAFCIAIKKLDSIIQELSQENLKKAEDFVKRL